MACRPQRGGCGCTGSDSTPRRRRSVRPCALGSTPGGGWPTTPPRVGNCRVENCGVAMWGFSLVEPQVRLEPVTAALAAEPRLTVAAEGGGRVEAVVGVRPHDAGAEPLRHPEDARALFRPHAGREPVRRVV